ncbi:damage-control phosphatase ARMT1 family protein [Marinitoga lauensis]|uniref:damage-control phosphatase ARMT1 family protein n=1 Tax=Marinitoga lauensis TaxID=2201189 RepID=UPI0010131879|nr:ARMT1-like domain-containing protein [Marinitoga lauensis]
MFAKYECIECIIGQIKDIINKDFKGYDEKQKFEIMKNVSLEMLKYSTYGKKPIEMARIIYERLGEYTGTTDYFKEEKKQSNETFLDVFDEMYTFLKESDNPLKNAAKLSALGNVIDYGVKNSFGELEWELENILKNKDFALDDFDAFVETLENSKILLYIHDNAGEVVLDKLFIKLIKEKYPELHVISAVRGEPVINDVTLEDAKEIGLDEVSSEIISSGSKIPGTLLSDVNQEFMIAYKQADMIISKGQGILKVLVEKMKIFTLF